MQLEINKKYHGFVLIEENQLKEANSVARLFRHEKSGAQLFHMENEDDNKVFSITFRTPPQDSTGLTHILEHSVLCGSRKFPVKEPFIELAKGSLNTFLNAMTFPDKTMYPIASMNEKDFFNLMDVYLDAVFYPDIYKTPEILMQEGWHYHLEDKADELTYKGVVYNEMKGTFSSPDSVLLRRIQDVLFPDTPYSEDSGGDPDIIPELTYEQFLDYHRRYYHPANSYIFLYGNGDLMKQLEFINENYLKDFELIEVDSHISVQKPFNERTQRVYEYPISREDDDREKTFFSLNFAVGRATDPELYLALEILEHLLLESPAAPLKKALIEAELGKDAYGQYDPGILQPAISIIVKNTDLDKVESFQKVVNDTLTRLATEGIDKKLIEASINNIEFKLREAEYGSYPKGLAYNIQAMDSWLYGENPTLHLAFEKTLEKIKTALTTDYFEKMIKEHLLSNTHSSLLILKPKKGMAEEKDAELKKKLEQYKAGLSDRELTELLEANKRLRERQESLDAPVNLETIPLLSLTDIERKIEELPLAEREEKGVKVLAHPMFTNNIAYSFLYFDTGAVSQELLPYMSLLSDILGKISTEKYGYEDLSKEINIHTGGIKFNTQIYGENGNDSKFYTKFIVKSKALMHKVPKLLELMGEIITSSGFEDSKRLKEIIQETRSRMEVRLIKEGYIFVAKRVMSYFSPEAAQSEILTGIAYYKFLSSIEKSFDQKSDEIIGNLKKASEAVFNKNNLLVSIVCDENDYKIFSDDLPIILDVLGDKKVEPASYKYELTNKNEGLLSQSKVQFVGKGGNFKRAGYSYSGIMQVLKSIARYDYLWNEVRVKGGAYGSIINFGRNGNVYVASYRDPNLEKTLKIYDDMYKYLEDFDANDREMTKYIIGTISNMDTPLTNSQKGERAVEYYLRHITKEELQRERDEVLDAKKEDIKALAGMMRATMEQKYLCVMGNEAKIKENKDIFNQLINVIE